MELAEKGIHAFAKPFAFLTGSETGFFKDTTNTFACFCEKYKSLTKSEQETINQVLVDNCKTLDKIKFNLRWVKSGMGILLSIITFVFRSLIIFMVQQIGFKTVSKEIYVIKVVVFAVSFINNGLLVMVMSANF